MATKRSTFSTREKLLVTAAFLMAVVLAVGTENHPGLVMMGQGKVAGLQTRPQAVTQAAPKPRENSDWYAPDPVSTDAAAAPTMPLAPRTVSRPAPSPSPYGSSEIHLNISDGHPAPLRPEGR